MNGTFAMLLAADAISGHLAETLTSGGVLLALLAWLRFRAKDKADVMASLIASVNTQLESANRMYDQAQEDRKDAAEQHGRELDAMKEDRDYHRGKVEGLIQTVGELQGKVSQLQAKADEAHAQHDEIIRLRADLDRAQADIASLRLMLDGQTSRADDLEVQLAAANQRIADLDAELEAEQRDHIATRRVLGQRQAELVASMHSDDEIRAFQNLLGDDEPPAPADA